MRAGWQAELALELESGMRVPYLSRYGRGVNSYFFLGNSGAEEVAGQVRFDNQALMGGTGWSLLWNRKMRRSASTENILEGDFSSVSAVLLSRVPVIYESVAGLKTDVRGVKVLVEAEKDLHQQIYRFVGRILLNLKDLRCRDIRHFVLHSVANGVSITMENSQSEELRFTQAVFSLSLQTFPYCRGYDYAISFC